MITRHTVLSELQMCNVLAICSIIVSRSGNFFVQQNLLPVRCYILVANMLIINTVTLQTTNKYMICTQYT